MKQQMIQATRFQVGNTDQADSQIVAGKLQEMAGAQGFLAEICHGTKIFSDQEIFLSIKSETRCLFCVSDNSLGDGWQSGFHNGAVHMIWDSAPNVAQIFEETKITMGALPGHGIHEPNHKFVLGKVEACMGHMYCDPRLQPAVLWGEQWIIGYTIHVVGVIQGDAVPMSVPIGIMSEWTAAGIQFPKKRVNKLLGPITRIVPVKKRTTEWASDQIHHWRLSIEKHPHILQELREAAAKLWAADQNMASQSVNRLLSKLQ